MRLLILAFILASTSLILTGCAHEQGQKTAKYPRKPADNPERKSGLPMLFYEAAETDADINNIQITPPKATGKPPAAPD